MQIHSHRARRTSTVNAARFVQAITESCTHRQCLFVCQRASVDVAMHRKAF